MKLSVQQEKELKARVKWLQRGAAEVTPALVVDDARDPASPLHGFFDWDDASAAHSFRLHVAETLLQVIRVKMRTPPRIAESEERAAAPAGAVEVAESVELGDEDDEELADDGDDEGETVGISADMLTWRVFTEEERAAAKRAAAGLRSWLKAHGESSATVAVAPGVRAALARLCAQLCPSAQTPRQRRVLFEAMRIGVAQEVFSIPDVVIATGLEPKAVGEVLRAAAADGVLRSHGGGSPRFWIPGDEELVMRPAREGRQAMIG